MLAPDDRRHRRQRQPRLDPIALSGFERAGLLPTVGWKQSKWVDNALMSRALGDSSRSPPAT
jgi:hypothetical protein